MMYKITIMKKHLYKAVAKYTLLYIIHLFNLLGFFFLAN